MTAPLDTLYRLIQPIVFRVDAERAHDLVGTVLAACPPAWLRWLTGAGIAPDPVLSIEVAGLTFSHPFGIAAGFDKQARLIHACGALGVSHVEIGTVTPRAQPGNPRPRMFRIPRDHAVINRLGFNSVGAAVVAGTLHRARHRQTPQLPRIGVNIGKNRDTPLERACDDYLIAFDALASDADYIAVNISSPNTPGLRQLHERAALRTLLDALVERRRHLPRHVPLFLKVSPDERDAQLRQVVDVALDSGIDGLIATNTTLARDGLSVPVNHAGGLSGRPLRARARRTIAVLATMTEGRVPIIGVGGVDDAASAYAHIRAGAHLVQCYTGLIYQGPGLPTRLVRDLAGLLRADGFSTLREAIGVDRERWS
jgi:dihydroorotate dehydrogenase